MARSSKGEGINVGANDRGMTWSPKYTMSDRDVKRKAMGSGKSNGIVDGIEGRTASKGPRQSK